MFRAILTFFVGVTLILLILGAISTSLQPHPPAKDHSKNTQSLHLDSQNTDEIVVRSEQPLPAESANNSEPDESNKNSTVQDPSDITEQQVAKEIEVLLESEANLTNIIETNISLLGKLGNSAAFLSHQTLLRKINSTEHIQPISIVCSNTRCNVLVYGASADVAEAFANTLIHEEINNINVLGGKYRIFREEDYDFAHVVLEVTEAN